MFKMTDKKNSQENKENFQHLVRVMNTDLPGSKQIVHALTKIKGISIMFANAVCKKAGVPVDAKTGYLNQDQVQNLELAISDPLGKEIPAWILNRRRDYETGMDKHLISGDLTLTKEMDIKNLKKTKSYRGLRHQWGLPLRGQRTKSNFRRNKRKGAVASKKRKK
jgi:small subunit ribosomal protein S13